MNECAYWIIILLRGTDDFVGQIFIGETEGTTQSIPDQVFGETTGEIILSMSDLITQFVIVAKRGSLVKRSGGIDVPDFLPFALAIEVLGPPLSGSVEVFQAEADRVDLAVAACALGFFLVCQKSLACGQNLILQT